MARYTSAQCRLCRREGMKLFLKGERCLTSKCALERRAYPPGQHGQGRTKRSDYGLQLREKQKVRRMYGVLEKQFRLYYQRAARMKGVTGENLLQLLERRLDNAVYRLNMATSRKDARQLVSHGHLLINGRRVDIPSIQVKEGDVIEVRERSKKLTRIEGSLELKAAGEMPAWLEMDRDAMKATVKALPTRDDIQIPVQESLIVELYSK
ncbi:MAG: 30S ribosomal protein S4 [Pseudomonadota bacterium]